MTKPYAPKQPKRKHPKPVAKKIRYAVVGVGHITQVAVLPAFAHAGANSELVAIISGDAAKRRALAERYGLAFAWSYEEYDEALLSGAFDAVYIALPNAMHRDFMVRAARAGIHVLCEKPLESSVEACEEMIRVAEEENVRLMTAYRLHFEEATLEAIEIVRSGRIGEPRVFDSTFGYQVKPGNDTRLSAELGAGVLWDLGIYCINAARNLFGAEPIEVFARTATGDDSRFREVEEMASAVLRFPEERLATFTCSFGMSDISSYRIVGTKGDLVVDPGYEYAGNLAHALTIGGEMTRRKFAKHDQFAPELLYFSECILEGKNPEPSGVEGWADVRVIQALYESADIGRPIALPPFTRSHRPSREQEYTIPPVKEPDLVNADAPSS